MIEITIDSVIDGLTAIVEECGEDFAYEQRDGKCVYVHEGVPDCIVGKFLANLGVPLERLEKADGGDLGSGEPATNLLRQLEFEGVVSIENSDAIYLLQGAQSKQDMRGAYGNVLRAVKYRAARFQRD